MGRLPEPIGRYDFSFSVQAVELETPPAQNPRDPEGGRLVSSGSFRVDVPRMLERLKERQFAERRDCLLPIFRAAAASGATAVEVARKGFDLHLRFDGRPFSARELNDPFRSLFEGDEADGLRGRQLAYGLLALARLGVAAVQVTSGGPNGQSSLVLSGRGRTPPEIGINRGEGTLLHVRWAGVRSWWTGRSAVDRLAQAYGLSATALTLDRRRLAAGSELGEGAYPFELDGCVGAFRFRGDDGPSAIGLYWLGTLIEVIRRDLPGQPPVDAVLTSARFSLDLSQARVAQDSRFEAAIETLISHVARRHGPAAKRAWYDVDRF
ncbi:MAG: hypothetical protein HY553_19280 [Elusimicrobia bacterium]|nr:hypothetical protein [Elusimicrobiota bacterium]